MTGRGPDEQHDTDTGGGPAAAREGIDQATAALRRALGDADSQLEKQEAEDHERQQRGPGLSTGRDGTERARGRTQLPVDRARTWGEETRGVISRCEAPSGAAREATDGNFPRL